LEYCIVKNCEDLDENADDGSPANIDFSFLEQFCNHNGVDIVMELKSAINPSLELFNRACIFEHRYFPYLLEFSPQQM